VLLSAGVDVLQKRVTAPYAREANQSPMTKVRIFNIRPFSLAYLFPLLNMPIIDYGKYRLISKPQKNHRGWVPFVFITWQDGDTVRSHIESPDQVCATEDVAVDFGFEAARRWIK
jgi:hypothetical protein